jgi:hypothetical protein
MNGSRLTRLAFLALAAAAAFGATGCVKKVEGVYRPNVAPSVRLTQAPLNDGTSYFYAYRLNWLGHDPDGRVAYFLYSIDPPLDGRPIDWTQTTNNEQILFFTAGTPDSSNLLVRAIDFHTFAICAVDDDGDTSEVITRSFWSHTVAPSVLISRPRPSHLITPQLTPAVRISWTGSDIDGQFTTKPVKYKFTLITAASEFPINIAISDPDSIRRFYAPEFVGWDSLPGDTTEVQYLSLTPGASYVFVVVAFDEAGAYSPVFSLNANVLRFTVGFAGQLGPILTMFNQYFFFRYVTGGYVVDPQREVFIEVPSDEYVTFNWFADTSPGADMESYRWALDIPDVSDNTPRDDEVTDVTKWSAASLLTQKATVGPFAESGEHRFYIEAKDNNNLSSLGIVRFQVVKSSFEKPILIVDDTRFKGDEVIGGVTRPPGGNWPTAAELDTFLYARGGVPWRQYPPGTMSTPGIFAGFPYETTGTRIGRLEMVVRLAKLGQYRHVVWIVDQTSATYNRSGTDSSTPTTALRYMSTTGRFNTLAAHAAQGGKVWLVGGGGAFATLIPWDRPNNNISGTTWSNVEGELIPGRFMYDLAGWLSEVQVAKSTMFFVRDLGRFDDGATYPPNDPGLPQPDFSGLPLSLRGKTQTLDPFPPNRVGQSPGVFYKSIYEAEFLSQPNFNLEDLDPDPDLVDERSVLDTLYKMISFSIPPTGYDNVCMTYYHGNLSERMVFTGFNVWDFTRADCVALVDFVLNELWGFTRSAPAPVPSATLAPAMRVVPAAPAREAVGGPGRASPARGRASSSPVGSRVHRE